MDRRSASRIRGIDANTTGHTVGQSDGRMTEWASVAEEDTLDWTNG